jgi:hypothetical protein
MFHVTVACFLKRFVDVTNGNFERGFVESLPPCARSIGAMG